MGAPSVTTATVLGKPSTSARSFRVAFSTSSEAVRTVCAELRVWVMSFTALAADFPQPVPGPQPICNPVASWTDWWCRLHQVSLSGFQHPDPMRPATPTGALTGNPAAAREELGTPSAGIGAKSRLGPRAGVGHTIKTRCPGYETITRRPVTPLRSGINVYLVRDLTSKRWRARR